MTKIRDMHALMAEARRQSRPSLVQRILWALGKDDHPSYFKRRLVSARPLRWLWQAKCALILYRKWNAPVGHPDRVTLLGCWGYAAGLAEMLDEPTYGYLSPSEAIDEDRYYWEG